MPKRGRLRGRGRCSVGDDRGAASVLAVGIVGAVVALTSLVVPAAATFVVSQRAANAADAAALAAADAISGAVAGVPCELAAEAAARNGAMVTACEVHGAVATVAASIDALGVALSSTARAGPPGSE